MKPVQRIVTVNTYQAKYFYNNWIKSNFNLRRRSKVNSLRRSAYEILR